MLMYIIIRYNECYDIIFYMFSSMIILGKKHPTLPRDILI